MSTKKVYLPKWQRLYIFPLLGLIWAFITYNEFFAPTPSDPLGLVGYLFITLLFAFIGLMTYLMTSGKLPAYIIKDDQD